MNDIHLVGTSKEGLDKAILLLENHGNVVVEKDNLPWSSEQTNVYDEQIKSLSDLLVTEDRFKYLRNFIFTYLRVNKITLEELKQNINNKSSDLTKSQRDFVINNL